jgi:hypothetical protein
MSVEAQQSKITLAQERKSKTLRRQREHVNWRARERSQFLNPAGGNDMAISLATNAATDALKVNRAPVGVEPQEVHKWLQSFNWDFKENRTKYQGNRVKNHVTNAL